MSKTVDERVLSMDFDNARFEANVKTSMSTLDRLKKALNFDGVGKGFANIEKAASKITIEPLSQAVDKVGLKFNAMQVAAITAMTRITNKAIDTGKRLVQSLSTDQIEAGWSKYNEKTASVQTMVNATGKSVTEINGYLDKLMRFSDETSFNFTEMTSALGNMLSAGGDIEKLIPMIEGVAGATAYAGKSGAEFVHVIRNINQSYSAGYLNLQDWKSVQLMNVNSKALMQTLIDVAVQQKKIKEGEVTLANFNESLKDKWADTEVMEAAFGKFSAIIQDAIDLVDSGKFEGTVSEAIDELAKNSEKYDEISVSAAKAAQNAKSFTEAIDATKDAVSSGWMKIFEKFFGDYDQAVKFWSDVTEILWELFVPGIEKINDLLDDAMSSKWGKIVKKVNDAGVSIENFEEIVTKNARKYNKDIDSIIKEEGSLQSAFDKGLIKKEAVLDSLKELSKSTTKYTESAKVSADKLAYFQKVVDEVWLGTWDNGHARVEKLTKAGYDYNKVQELVNKTVDGHRLTLADLNEEELKAIGYTEEETKAIKELAKEAQQSGTDINNLINALERPTGRELFTDSILTFLEGLEKAISQVSKAWEKVFGKTSSSQIYETIKSLNEASKSFSNFFDFKSKDGKRLQNVLTNTFTMISDIKDVIEEVTNLASQIVKNAITILWDGLNSNGKESNDFLDSMNLEAGSYNELYKKVEKYGTTLDKLDKKKLKDAGYTSSEIKNLEKIKKAADEAGQSYDEFMKDLYSPTGTELLTDSLEALIEAARHVVELISSAWSSIFEGIHVGSNDIYSVIQGINNASHSIEDFLNPNSDTGNKLQRTLQGVFAILDLIDNTVGYALVTSIRSLCRYLGLPIDDMLTMSAALGDLAVKANNWVWEWRKNSKFLKSFDTFWNKTFYEMVNSVREWVIELWKANKIQPVLANIEDFLLTFGGGILNYVKGGAKAIGEFISYLLHLKDFDFSLDSILNVFRAFKDKVLGYFLNFKNISFEDYIKRAIEGIKTFLDNIRNMDGLSVSNIWKAITDFFENIISKIFNLGEGTKKAGGFFDGLKTKISTFAESCDSKITSLWNTLKSAYNWLAPKFAWLDGIDFGEVLTIGLGVGTIKLMKSVRLGIDGLTAAFKDLTTIRQAITGVFGSMSSGIRNIADAFVKKIKVGTFEKKTKAILNLAFAIGILAASVAVLAWIPADKLWTAVEAIAVLAGVLSVLMLVAGRVTKIGKLGVDLNGAGVGLLSLVAALIILTRAVKIISKINTKNAAISAAIVAGLIIVLTGCAKVLSGGAGKLAEGGLLLLEMAGSLLIMSFALQAIASIRSDRLKDAVWTILGLMAILAGGAWAMSLGGEKTEIALLSLVGALLALALVFKIIASLDMSKVMDNIVSIGVVLGSLILIMRSSWFTVGTNGKSGLGIMGMAASLLLIALAIKVIGKIPTNELTKGTIVVGILMLIMSGFVALTKFAGQYAAKAAVTLLAMGATMMLLVIPIAVLSQIKPEKLKKAVTAIGVLMILMGILMGLSAFTGNANYKNLIGIAVAVGVMAVSLGALAMIKAERLKQATTSLGVLMGMFALLEAASYLTNGASIKVILVMGAILAELVGVFYLMSKINLDSALEQAAALSLVLATLVGATLVLGTFGAGAAAGVTPGLLALSEVVGVLVALFGIIGGLNELTKGALGDFVNGGMDILISIFDGLGTCIGKFIGSIMGNISDSFVTVGSNLNKFWVEVKPFFTDLTSLNETQVAGARAFADILLALTECHFTNSDLESLDGETIKTYFSDIGTALYSALHDSEGFAGLTEDDKKLITLAAEMFDMFSQIQTPPDNIWADLTSATLGLNEYAGQIKMAGEYLNVAFDESHFGSDLFKDDLIVQRVQRLCDIFNAFAEVKIPYSSLSFSTLSSFATNLKNAAPKLVEAFGSENFGNEVFNNMYLPQRAQRISEVLTSFASIKVPPSGLLDDTIKSFANKLNAAAPNIVSVVNQFKDANITETDISSAKNAAAALNAFASISSDNLDPENLVSFINALNGTYAEGGGGLLDKLVAQLGNMKSVGDAKDTVVLAADSIKSLISSCTKVNDIDCINLLSFSNTIGNVATGLSSFCSTVSGIDETTMTSMKTNIDDVISKVKSMNNIDSTGIKGFTDSLVKLAKDGIQGFVDKFANSQTDTDSAISSLVTNASNSAKSETQKTKIGNAFAELVTKAVSTIKGKKSDFTDSGSYCVDGFVLGIDNNIWKAYNAGTRLGDAAYKAAKEAIDSNSPAKKFIQLGNFSGEGFIIGMDNMRRRVATSGRNMASSAIDSVRESIEKVSDVIQNDVDAQPVIRPIVDLSEAKTSARALSSMFNGGTSVGIATQINNSRRRKVQSTNDDVVSAIKELGATQGSNGNTYNINGITYDDGSNVADAVRTLIRAARVERRT